MTADTPAKQLAPRTVLPPPAEGFAPPRWTLAGSPLPLTVREREIANLVAAGLTNRDIADRLTVSVRTVEGHLYRACTKCDCTDRDQLAALIRSGQPR